MLHWTGGGELIGVTGLSDTLDMVWFMRLLGINEKDWVVSWIDSAAPSIYLISTFVCFFVTVDRFFRRFYY